MSDDEVMRFEITDHDLDNEFNFGLRRPRMSKNRATYGIWAEDSDEADSDPDSARPSFGGGKSGKKGDYSAPVGFVSAGFKKTAKEEAEELSKKGNDEDENQGDTLMPQQFGGKSKKLKKTNKVELIQGGQIAGLRKAGHSQAVNLGKGFGDWEKHTKGIGAKLLLKMGYEAGKGLGKELQGRATIVEAHLRKGRGAVGAYGKEGNRPSKTKVDHKDSEEEEEEEFKDKLHQWKKGQSGGKKVKYVYKTADQVLEDGKWRQVSEMKNNQGLKIIDMTGKEQRILSSYHALNAQKITIEDHETPDAEKVQKVIFDLPELRHNIDLLLDQCEEELIANDRALKSHKNRIEILQKEEEKLDKIIQAERQEMSTLQGLLQEITALDHQHQNGTLTLESAKNKLEKLNQDFPKEYQGLEMPYIAMTIVVPLIKKQLSSWNCLANPRLYFDEFLLWKKILTLQDHDENEESEPMDPFHKLLWESWMPKVRQSITSWNVKDANELENLQHFLQIWNHLIPKWMQSNIHQHVLLPKLQAQVELWDPRMDEIPIDSWIVPWLPMLGDHLDIVYPTIRQKLANALNAWHPRDASAKGVLAPWFGIFSETSMNSFILKNILPKLEQSMAMEFVVNPLQQDLNPWHWVMDWKDLIPSAALINLLERHFFPKWLQVLASWLNQNPNYNEVTNWYKGWKSQIPKELIATPQVQHQLQQALDMMTRVVSMSSGHPMARQPGANEAMMYLSNVERQFKPSGFDMRTGSHSKSASVSEAVKMASQMASGPGSYRDLIARRCEERDILFRPMPSRFQEGKQVYQCGSLLIYLDRNAIFAQTEDKWIPTSLNSLLDSA